jgi:hypothetical protein
LLSHEVDQAFCNFTMRDEVERVPAEMARLFAVPEGGLHLGRDEAEAWLGRGW